MTKTEKLLALPMTRVVATSLGNSAAWSVGNMLNTDFPRHRAVTLGDMIVRDLMAMPEAGRAHLAAMLMENNRWPLKISDPGGELE